MSVEGQETVVDETESNVNTTEVAVEGQTDEVDVSKLMDEVTQLKSTNDRLLNQSKDNAEKYRVLRDKTEAKTKDELIKNDNYKGLYEQAQKELGEVKEVNSSLKKTSLDKSLDMEIAKLLDKPLQDGATVDDVIDQVLKTGMVELTDDGTNFLNVKEAYEAVKLNKSYLFNDKRATMANSRPDSTEPKSKKYSALSAEERSKLRSKLIKDKYDR